MKAMTKHDRKSKEIEPKRLSMGSSSLNIPNRFHCSDRDVPSPLAAD
ncbi:hypothetical protein [Rhizobium binae]